jgi:FkbM family methyltransferase
MRLSPFYWTGRALRRLGNELVSRGGMRGTWIDVGAHEGETTLQFARLNPGLRVYALEPNLRAVARLLGQVPNFIVLPMAIAETDGCAEFHINAFEMGSSLLPLNEEGLTSWVGVSSLKEESVVSVPTVRLDTLMNLLGIRSVDFLKIDTQGLDLAVLKSAGDRLRDVAKITLEVEVAPVPLYKGAASKDEVMAFLSAAGFDLVGTESQTYGQEENLTFVRVKESCAMA